ncbi:hypothetical protein AAGV28_07055 [Flavobacterium sp. FZUC8N2.13]|uniref:Uncharacterized protein n=1 Tax=Flavobacterium zubiriense TaxID=3138075 RepID=A0ABV4TCT9_9FLAO
MKNKVIEFFQNLPVEKHEQFNTAFELYRKSEGNNESIVRSLNAVGYTESNLQNLLYDLQKLHGITDVEKVRSEKLEVRSQRLPDERIAILSGLIALLPEHYIDWVEALQESNYTIENLTQFAVAVGNDKAVEVLKAVELASLKTSDTVNSINDIVVNGLKEENETLLSEKEDLEYEKEVLEDENSDLHDENEALKEKVNELTAVTGTSIREEFPFLNDSACPNELKILVADKITAWKIYQEKHAQLLQIESGELVVSKEEQSEIAEAAKVAFEENQAIYDELNVYKETGKLLGKHSIFKTLQFQREVDEMSPEQLNKYIGSSSKYFSDNKKSLAKAEQENDEAKIIEIKERVADREMKLSMVNKKLGISTK